MAAQTPPSDQELRVTFDADTAQYRVEQYLVRREEESGPLNGRPVVTLTGAWELRGQHSNLAKAVTQLFAIGVSESMSDNSTSGLLYIRSIETGLYPNLSTTVAAIRNSLATFML